MIASAEEHYEGFLARHYTWMRGDYTVRVRENRDFFERNEILPRSGGRGLDLGCGSGFQSVALAELGFGVLGVDFSETLLAELRDRTNDRLRIRLTRGDLRDGRAYAAEGPFEVVVCMGDTLTHLRSGEEVAGVIRNVYRVLEEGGRFILQFRDLTEELKGAERAIPVRAGDDRIFTTFLEYEGDHVNVHDLLFVREASGWTFHKGVYAKLRLGAQKVLRLLKQAGFETVSHSENNGFQVIIARKPL